MKTLLITLATLFTFFGHTSGISGQNNPGTTITADSLQHFTITGIITDKLSLQPLVHAHIAVFDEHRRVLLTGALSDYDGNFRVDVVSDESVYLRLSSVGYETHWMMVHTKTTHLQTIQLLPADLLGADVLVQAEAIPVLSTSDRIRYYPSARQLEISASALEVLRFLPGVQLSLFQDITLDGNSDVLILVDGKQRDKQFLQQLPPSQIERIELLPVPPPGFESSGGGAIHVVLRAVPDYYLGVRAHAEIPARINEQFLFPNASVLYSRPTFTLQSGYSGERTRFKISDKQRYTDMQTGTSQLTQQDLIQQGYMHRFTSGLGFQAGSSSHIDLYGWVTTYGQEHNGSAVMLRDDHSNVESVRSETDRNRAGFLSAHYRYEAAPRSLTAALSHYEMQTNADIAFEGIGLYAKINPKERVSTVRAEIHEKELIPADVRYGISWQHTQRGTDSFVDSLSEQTSALYIRLARKIGSIDLQGSLRGEYNSLGGWYVLPTLMAHHRFGNQKTTVRFHYRTTVIHPGIFQRYQQSMWGDPLHVSVGNQALRASLQRDLVAELSHNTGSGSLSVRYTLAYNHDPMQQRIERISQESFLSSWYNARYSWGHRVRMTGMLAFSSSAGVQMWVEPGTVQFADAELRWFISGGGSMYWRTGERLTLAVMVNHEGHRIGEERRNYSGTLYFANANIFITEAVSASLVSGIPFSGGFLYDGFRAGYNDLEVHSTGRIRLSMVPVWATITMEINRGGGTVSRRDLSKDQPQPSRRTRRVF
ncbi:MAG: outer membrane beta-barrel protein [Bacteroidetes bacterium]|nr:outer membrane beta-barrel protein [Bacteroidota bacterium]MCH8523146.1 TonB-dependent receptor family protein [Balneolales bacterium]